jgi:Tol biopolymer transport system component/DNA-binding winged helix-turn-helix (wHTH) protein
VLDSQRHAKDIRKQHVPPMYRFGAYQFDPNTHELRRSGIRIKIQEQPFTVLLKLLERPGELVTREELRLVIWPADTFVDFDTGLNTVIMRLREVLRDSAEAPQFIETVPKLGYRFIAPVKRLEGERAGTAQTLKKQRISSGAKWTAAAAILLAASALAYLFLRRTDSRSGASVEVVPLTGMPGSESDPAFSPDGNQVAFRFSDDSVKGRSGIYTTFVGGEKTLQLTNDPSDCCPVWSPDGRSIGFARTGAVVTNLYTLPALGGTPRKIYSIEKTYKEHIRRAPDFSWSPDGQFLVVSIVPASNPSEPERRQAIALVSLASSSTRLVTSPPPEFSDWSPAFSPDGKLIAFLRSSGPGPLEDLYVVTAAGGEPKRLTFDRREIDGAPTWTPDGRDIIFSSARGGRFSLWRIPASGGGAPSRIEGAGTSVFSPAVALKSQRLAYVNMFIQLNLWKVPLSDAKHVAQSPQLLFATKGETSLPYFSPDGRKLAFESTQSGYREIWTVNSDGSSPSQLTFLNGESGTPRWSRDGRFIAFDYRPADHSEIYVVEVPGGAPHIFPTIRGADNTEPNFSHDGKWLYFSSNRGNEVTQLWKASYPSGGAPVQLTKNGGVRPVESADGFVYFARTFHTDEIWKIPASGGEESLVMKGTGLRNCWDWALSSAGIYFMNEEGKNTLSFYEFATRARNLSFYEFATRKTFPIVSQEKLYGHPAAAPDGKSIVFSQIDQRDRTIMLVNHFR